MQYLKTQIASALLAMVSAVAVAASPKADPPAISEIDAAVAAIASYATDQPRSALDRLERISNATFGQPELRAHLEQKLVELVGATGTSDESRRFICRQLAQIGTDTCVPGLRKLLADDKTAHLACIALCPNRSRSAGDALRDAAGSPATGPRGLLCIINALGDRGEAESVAVLERLVERPDDAVVEASLRALGRIASARAAAVLYAMARVPQWRDVANGARLQCASRLAAAGDREKAMGIYRQLLGEEFPMHHRRGALGAMIDLGGPEAVPLVLTTLGGKDRVLQATAIAHVRMLQGTEVTRRFAEELPRLPANLQSLLIDVLEDRGDVAARSAVAQAASHADPAVRLAAVKALGTLGDASSVGLLVKTGSEAAADAERRAALASLRRLRGDGVNAAIASSMADAVGTSKAALIDVLSDRLVASAVPAFLKEAASSEPAVRRSALSAVGRLAGVDALPELLDILVRLPDENGRADAEAAAIAVARKEVLESRRAEAVIATLRKAKSVPAQQSLVRVLRGIGTSPAYDAVVATLKSAEPAVQDAAVRALADWPDARALPTLLEISRTTANPTHRVVAMRGCVRLLNVVGATPVERAVESYRQLNDIARSADEKRLVLSGLASVAHPTALAIAQALVDDASVRDEASHATLRIARSILGSWRTEAAAAVRQLAGKTTDETVRSQADDLLALINKMGDFITSWQVAGPYSDDGGSYNWLFNLPVGPERISAGEVQWRNLPAVTDPLRPTILDLAAAVGGEQRIAFVRTWVHSDTEQEAQLELGVDDLARVWLNDRIVHAKNTPGACIPGSEKVRVTLRRGWNPLQIKIAQATGPWEFCARLVAADGSRLSGVRAEAAPAGVSNGQGIRLFDGKSLEGWEGPKGVFRIEDGAIVAGTLKQPIPRNEFLSTKKEYGDFELRLEFKLLGKDPNAGIQIRSRRIPNNNEMIGYQADMGQQYWGCLYDESRRNRVLAGPKPEELKKALHLNDWNTYRIRCEGKRIQLWINDFQTVDYTETDAAIEQVGVIGLQIHGGPPSEAWYRNLILTELRK